MANRKLQSLDLQAVSKCKKQRLNQTRKVQTIRLHNHIQFIQDLQEEFPEPGIHHDMLFTNTKLQSKISTYESRDFEDSNLTKHVAQQLLIIKVMQMIMTVLSILLARIGHDSKDQQIYTFNGQKVVLVTHSLITITMLTMSIMNHIKTRQLVIKQLIRFSPYQLNPLGINPSLILQLLFLLIHPNIFLQSHYTQIRQPVTQQYINISSNNILEIIMFGRIYLVYSAIVSSTLYLSTRGSRICRIYGTKCDLYFGFKCLFNTRPLLFLVVIFISMLFVFAQMVRLSQEENPVSPLGTFGNSLWCVIITMGTVGYGDYSPQTYLGRAILFLASITGIIVASLLILTLSTYLSMELSQNKAHITMHRLVLRDKMQQLAKGVMHKTAILSKMQGDKSERQIKSLKKQTDDVKYTLRKIKNLIDTDNINEEMDRLFECLEDNMKDAYLNQVRYGEALQLMHSVESEKINEMKFSFTEEIQNIIKDR